MKNPISQFWRRLGFLVGGAATALVLFGLAEAQGALISGLYSTGVDNTGALLGAGVVDPHYKLIVSPDAGAPGPDAYTLTAGPIPPWVAQGPNSQWIAPAPNQNVGSAEGNYTYRITFDLTGFNPASAKIEGNWTSDNAGTAVLLNGTSTGINQNGSFGQLFSFMIDTGFVDGTNTLDFVVNNAPATPNPTGLRVDLIGTVSQPGEPPSIAIQPASQRAVVGDTVTFSVLAVGTELAYQWRFNSNDIPGEMGTNLVLTGVTTNDTGYYDVVVANFDGSTSSIPALLSVSLPIPGLFNTGIGEDRQPLPADAVDPHYALVVNPDSASTDAFVQEELWPIIPAPNGVWLANSNTSKWIGPRANPGAAAAIGDYAYRMQFDLTGLDPATAYLAGDWTSDNAGIDIVLNGFSTGVSQGGSFGTLSAFVITTGFISGINTLEFHVNNAGPNTGPTGLRVENFRGGALPGTTGDVPPSILTQPSSQVALTGEGVTFTVLADGTPPLRYQWYRNDAIINDATNQALTRTGLTTNDSGNFYVQVSNDFGTTNSVVVTLTVLPPIPGLYNTGVDDTGALLSNNTSDPHYFLAVNPDTNTTTIVATTMAGGWPVAPAGPWLAEGPDSRWLFPPGNDGTNAAHGLYVFVTTFDLTGYDPTTALIRGQWAADDAVLDVVLNGRSLGLQNLSGFGNFASFSISNAFVAGENSLAFVVNNGGTGFFMNPCGLRVELHGTALPATCIWPGSTLVRSANGQSSQEVMVVLPPGLNQTADVQVTVTSDNPDVAEPLGGTSGSLTMNFPAGGSSSRAFTVNARTLGSAVFSLTGPAGTCVGTNVTVVVGESLVTNPSLEDFHDVSGTYYSQITGWKKLTPSGNNTGVSESSGPFWDNGNNSDRTRVGFAQNTGGVFQEIWGLIPGKRYLLRFSYNTRACCSGTMGLAVRFNGKLLASVSDIQPVGAGAPFNSVVVPFIANADYGLLEFATLVPESNGDRSLLLDGVSLVQRDEDEILILNPSFEASGIPARPGDVGPTPIDGWTGAGGYGVNRTGEGPFADNGTAEDQRNVLFLQNEASGVSQVISNLTPGALYTLSYAFNARGGNTPRLLTTLDGNVVHEQDITPVGVAAPYYSTNIQFNAAGETVTLAFAQTATGDNTVLLDNVRITAVAVKLSIRREPGGSVRLSWPVSATGYTLQSSTIVTGGYSDTGLSVTQEGDENVVYDTAASGNRFYVLFKP